MYHFTTQQLINFVILAVQCSHNPVNLVTHLKPIYQVTRRKTSYLALVAQTVDLHACYLLKIHLTYAFNHMKCRA